jgi:hypothetical protein
VNADAVVAVSAAVVALTQLAKWAKLPEQYGPIAVIVISGFGVLVWLAGADQWPPARTDIWPIFSGWVAVTLTAAGTFGFTRAAVGAVTRATPPPDGAAEQAVETSAWIDYERLAAEMERQRQARVRADIERKATDGVRSRPA